MTLTTVFSFLKEVQSSLIVGKSISPFWLTAYLHLDGAD